MVNTPHCSQPIVERKGHGYTERVSPECNARLRYFKKCWKRTANGCVDARAVRGGKQLVGACRSSGNDAGYVETKAGRVARLHGRACFVGGFCQRVAVRWSLPVHASSQSQQSSRGRLQMWRRGSSAAAAAAVDSSSDGEHLYSRCPEGMTWRSSRRQLPKEKVQRWQAGGLWASARANWANRANQAIHARRRGVRGKGEEVWERSGSVEKWMRSGMRLSTAGSHIFALCFFFLLLQIPMRGNPP